MELNHYQEQAMTTCMPSSNNVAYMFLNLVGEVGELTMKMNTHIGTRLLGQTAIQLYEHSRVAKMIRKQPAENMHTVQFYNRDIDGMKADKDLQKELGDILWQLSGLCSVLGLSLEDIAQQNLDKLASRQQRNVIDGEGDNR